MERKQHSVENHRVQNATPSDYDGIHFRSKLEVMVYKTLKEQGLSPSYEDTKFVILEGFRPTVPFYTKDKTTRMLKENSKKLIDSTYTPDFIVRFNGYTVIIESKGILQDSYMIKRKLFRKYLEEHQEEKYLYFEIYTKRQLLQAIDIIKKLN